MYNTIKESSWKSALKNEFNQSYLKTLETFLAEEKALGKNILPQESLWFNALNSTPLTQVKVVILGQDPYPTLGHAYGLSFSALDPIHPLPKSLQNIYKELKSDLNIDNQDTANLQPWAEQGVLLLNAVLTVEEGKANAHKNKGWEKFTDKIIHLVNDNCDNVVFILWGAYAQKKAKFIDDSKHLIIKDPHPSPLSAYRGFWGSKPFSKANEYLKNHNKSMINWEL
ncbi:MAG: Uracil-DNA glycosylase, family 1 [uncultured Sulfurovum sp.]|uniref:Uracil-DNA glycosylase n=1 Tax=uncultured Sulfurovum sp. TaxID=269237 RepID=A0A6S6RVN3_9BACT|nr:MAG: Uracil-DNA glycosylase, family 1 [uncultured Sulfurovum sp.]